MKTKIKTNCGLFVPLGSSNTMNHQFLTNVFDADVCILQLGWLTTPTTHSPNGLAKPYRSRFFAELYLVFVDKCNTN